MNFHELAGKGLVIPLHGTQLPANVFSGISQTATFKGKLKIGRDVAIYTEAWVGADCLLSDGVGLDNNVFVDDEVVLENGVQLSERTTVFQAARIGQRATIGAGVIIGRNVNLPAEVQVGANIVIPSTDTIVALGRLGWSARTVTIHGSDQGPRFSIGCQDSVSEDTISARIRNATGTTDASAAHYKEYLDSGVFSAIGSIVQKHYDAQSHLITDLIAEAADLAEQR